MSGSLEQMGPGVLAWLDDDPGPGRPNAGVVIDDDGLTLVDTLMVASQWEPFAAAIEALDRPIRRGPTSQPLGSREYALRAPKPHTHRLV